VVDVDSVPGPRQVRARIRRNEGAVSAFERGNNHLPKTVQVRREECKGTSSLGKGHGPEDVTSGQSK